MLINNIHCRFQELWKVLKVKEQLKTSLEEQCPNVEVIDKVVSSLSSEHNVSMFFCFTIIFSKV